MRKILAKLMISFIFVIGIMTCFSACADNENVDLLLSINNLSVSVGERVRIDYSVNNKDAVVSFEIDDDSVAKIEMENSSYYVVGLSAGQTKIVLIARYGKYENKATAILSVSKENDGSEDGEEVKYTFDNFNNITFENGILTMTGYVGWFSIGPVGDTVINTKSVVSNNSHLTINDNKSFGEMKVVFINCDESGEYKLLITVNGTEAEFILKVEL